MPKETLKVDQNNHPEQSQIDSSLIEYHLRLSYEQRLEAHEAARQLLEDLKSAGQQFYAKQSQSPA